MTKAEKEVKDQLNLVGISFKRDDEWGEYQIWPSRLKGHAADAVKYHVDTGSEGALEDVLATGKDMAKRLVQGGR